MECEFYFSMTVFIRVNESGNIITVGLIDNTIHYLRKSIFIHILSQKLTMQVQQKSQKNISTQQISPSPLSNPHSTQSTCQRLINPQKTHNEKIEEKLESAPTLKQTKPAQEDTDPNDKCSNLLFQSRNGFTSTPIKQGSTEHIKTSLEKFESQEQFLNKVIAEEQRNKLLLYQQAVTVNRKAQQEIVCTEDEGSLLPLASVVKLNSIIRVQESQSSESDNNSQHKTKISKNHQIATLLGQSFQSQYISEDDQTINKCQNCQALQQKAMLIMAENNQYLNTINILMKKCSLLKNKPQSTIHIEIPEMYEDFQSYSNSESFSDQLKSNLRILQSAISQIKYPGFHQVLDFDNEDKKVIWDLLKKLKFLLNVLEEGKQDKSEQEIKMIPILHEKYRKYIEEIKSNYEKKIDKLQQDFKNFVVQLREKSNEIQHSHLHDKQRLLKNGRIKKKTNSCTMDKFQLQDDILHLKQQLQHLQYTNQQEKKKIRILQRQNKMLAHKYTQEINDLKSQKNYYASTAQRYQIQFQKFMERTSSHPTISVMYYQQFFKQISSRIFQISNCIPFEENDQQNLFAPESQNQLFEMIERIRRFSMTVQAYYSQKDKQFCNLKKSITIFFKRLLDAQRISLKSTLDTIKNCKDLQLDYLRDYLNCLRKKKVKFEQGLGQPKKKQIKMKSLSLQKVDSLTFLSDEAHRNSESE